MRIILSKRELEEITKCERVEVCKHDYVPCEYCGIEIARTALAYREMLERIEWCCLTDYGIGRAPTCPFCGNVKSEGHKPDCEWVVAMKWE